MRIGELGEFALIAKIEKILKAPASRKALVQGIGDDAAVVLSGRSPQVLTVDALTEGTHFDFRYTDAESLGWKALAVNLSDVAAMGAIPQFALVALGLPRRAPLNKVLQLVEGIRRCGKAFATSVVGGNVSRTRSSWSVTVTVAGECLHGRPLLRSGARAGDIVCVTGQLGLSCTGLAALKRGLPGFGRAKRRHRRPVPRLAWIHELLRHGVRIHACIDVSDGLSSDLAHLCEASRLGALVDLGRLPIESGTRKAAAWCRRNPYRWALDGGEDYELLMTMAQTEYLKAKRILGTRLTAIGTMIDRRTILGVWPDGSTRTLKAGGYRHF
jgi:thiamine-monophosphate kinase